MGNAPVRRSDHGRRGATDGAQRGRAHGGAEGRHDQPDDPDVNEEKGDAQRPAKITAQVKLATLVVT
jgi:hypothetical protein